jgi:hypothetical protein
MKTYQRVVGSDDGTGAKAHTHSMLLDLLPDSVMIVAV